MVVKTGKISILTMAVIFLVAGNVFAGAAAKNISTQSVLAYMSGGGRYAETEDGDTPLNNLAGTAFMADGFHMHFSTMFAQNLWVAEKMDTGVRYENESNGLMPFFGATYKKDKWAGFFTLSVPGGTGGGSFDPVPEFDANAKIASDMLDRTVIAEDQELDFFGGKIGFTIGGAYKINDMFSVGYGLRAIYAINSSEGGATFVYQDTGEVLREFKVDQTANGWGIGQSFCFLFNYDKFKFGLRYDPKVKIEVEYDIDSNAANSSEDGSKARDDLPAALFSGTSYQLTPKLKFGGGFVYYWQKGTEYTSQPNTDKWDNAWEVQSFLEYALSPKWELLCGVNYYTPGVPEDVYTIKELSHSPAWTFAGGVQYRPSSRWTFMTGLGYAYYPHYTKTLGDPNGVYQRSPGKTPIQYYLGFEYHL